MSHDDAAASDPSLPIRRAEPAHPFDVGTERAAPVLGTIYSASELVVFDAQAWEQLYRLEAAAHAATQRELQHVEVLNDDLLERLDAAQGALRDVALRQVSLGRIRLLDRASGMACVVDISLGSVTPEELAAAEAAGEVLRD